MKNQVVTATKVAALTMGRTEDSGFEVCSTGEQIYINYHSEHQALRSLEEYGFTVLKQGRLPSPSAAVKNTTDLIVIAVR